MWINTIDTEGRAENAHLMRRNPVNERTTLLIHNACIDVVMSFPSSTLVLRAILTRLPKNSLFHCFSPGPPSPEQVTSSSAEQVKETTKT